LEQELLVSHTIGIPPCSEGSSNVKAKTGHRTTRPQFGTDFDLGWVGFVHSHSLLSQSIAFVTRRDREGDTIITHNFLVTGPDECVEANLPDGVVTNTLGKSYLDRDELLVLFRKPRDLTPAIAQRVVKRTRAQVGAKFDYGTFVAEGLNGTFLGYLLDTLFQGKSEEWISATLHQKDRWVCSELIAYCFREEPKFRDRGILTSPPGTITPQAMFEDDVFFEPFCESAGQQ